MKISEIKWTSLMKKLNQNLFEYLVFFFLFLSSLANSEEKFINGYQVRVIDGDSVEIMKEKIRLFGIDAPEINQMCYKENNIHYACGHVSKLALERYIKKFSDYKIYCYYSERDKYNRILGDCYIGPNSLLNINRYMVFEGYAVAYLRYSEKYLDAQETAKSNKKGLWAGKFDLPEEWRKKNK